MLIFCMYGMISARAKSHLLIFTHCSHLSASSPLQSPAASKKGEKIGIHFKECFKVNMMSLKERWAAGMIANSIQPLQDFQEGT